MALQSTSSVTQITGGHKISPERTHAAFGPPHGEHNPKTEAALIHGFVRLLPKGSRSHGSPNRMLLHELGGLVGQPDLLDVRFRALPGEVDLDVFATSLRSPAKARLLALLKFGSPRKQEYLEKFTGISKHALKSHLNDLENAGLIKMHKTSSVSLSCPLPWTMAHIVVYEGKLTNWRRALHQAIGYRSFSHSAWVVMPEPGATHAAKLNSVFKTNGIGLISVDDAGNKLTKIKSREHRPASRRLYLMAVGATLSRFVAEGRRLHRRLRPESIQTI